MKDWLGLRPAYSLRAHVPAGAARSLMKAMSATAGRILITPHTVDSETGLQSVTIETDGPVTHHQVRNLLHDRLGENLVHLADPAMSAAATGKITQRLCVPVATDRDLAMLDLDADRRVTTHLLLRPRDLDACSGRRRRVALLSDATDVLDLGPMPAALALPALESMAVHLRRATGLDVHPLPVEADSPEDFAATAKAIAPGFAALCLAHTRPAHGAAVRAALAEGPTRVADTASAHAVATVAAALSALNHKGQQASDAAILLVGPDFHGDLVRLLHATGVGELILHTLPVPDPEYLSGTSDLIIDLTGDLTGLSDGTPIVPACPQTPPPLHDTTRGPHPLHALPALLTATARGARPDTPAMLAAAHRLACLIEGDQLLPPADRPGLAQALTAELAGTHGKH